MNNNETKTDFLMARISQNENNQTVDINKWAFEKIKNTDEKINILELCCGTGKQTEYLVQKFPNATISCLDISIDAISAVKNKFHSHDSRMKFFNTGIDDFFKNNEEKFVEADRAGLARYAGAWRPRRHGAETIGAE